MAQRRYESLDHELHSQGFLSLNKVEKWLREYHPEAHVSYPTLLRLVRSNKLRARLFGKSYRVTKAELERYVVHGNYFEEAPKQEAPVTLPKQEEEDTSLELPTLLEDEPDVLDENPHAALLAKVNDQPQDDFDAWVMPDQLENTEETEDDNPEAK